jgi:hypothetical protein
VAGADRRLLKSQKNEVLRVIEGASLDPRDFHWDQTYKDDAYYVDRLVHTASSFWFEFDYIVTSRNSGHFVRFAPGEDSTDGGGYPGPWSGALDYFARWLRFLRREIEAPSLWEQLAGGEPLLEASTLPGAADTPFEPAELAAIDAKLDEVISYFRRELPAGSIPALEASVGRLRANARTSGRLSWIQMAIGTAISLAWGGFLAPEQARTFVDMIGQAFQRLLGGG